VVVGANFAGGALPFSLLLALGGILLVATCIAQMARRFPTAGGFYTFVSRGRTRHLARWCRGST
jgi:amino acid transporter